MSWMKALESQVEMSTMTGALSNSDEFENNL